MITNNKLFLLSFTEVKRYFPIKESRVCRDINNNPYFWWLRTPGSEYSGFQSFASQVTKDGNIIKNGNYISSTYHIVVRPALHINIAYLKSLERTKDGCVNFGGSKWLVLNEHTGLLLSKGPLSYNRRFDAENPNYEKSEIREYLNSELLDEVFTNTEQRMIVNTVIDGEESHPETIPITDKLFLLSWAESVFYLSCNDRRCKWQGDYIDYWLLRTPGSDGMVACANDYEGEEQDVGRTDMPIRPALYLDIAHLKTLPRTPDGYIKFGGRKWLLLSKNTGMMLSKEAVAQHRFDEKSNDYMESDIRVHLNDVLLNKMFTLEEQKMIVEAVIDGQESHPAD